MSMNNTDAEKMRVANEMLEAWNSLDLERALALFSEDAVMDSMIGKPYIGREAIRENTKNTIENLEFMDMRVIRMGIVDGHVMMERLDEYIIHGQHRKLPIAGVMKIVDGKVTEWREYMDHGNWSQDKHAGSDGSD